MKSFNYQQIDEAYKKIHDKVIKTPLITNDFINNLLNAKVYFKCENLQNTGSFKFRGATYKILRLNDIEKKNGVVAYSSGNHAQAVALASKKNKIKSKIVMPKNAPKIKIQNTKKYNAEIILYDPQKKLRENIAEEIVANEKSAIIRPYDDYDIIAGQGTAGKEIAEELDSLSILPDIYLCCCGGGGLIAGTSTYLKHKFPNIQSYSVEPEGFDDTKISLEAGSIKRNKINNFSICDALLAPQPGNITFPINKENLSGGLVVKDEEVKKIIPFIAEHLKMIIEPGGAVAATAAMLKKTNIENKTVVVMISGGNIDSEMFINI